jgi:hypothetical protein
MHILFVEDEAKIANFVRAGLKEQGFVVDYCDNGDEGYTRALDNEYDAIAKRCCEAQIVLDIMVPGKDLEESSPERKSWNTSGAMISIPIPMWWMCVCSGFVKKLARLVERVGLKAFEALDIDSVNQSLRGCLPTNVKLSILYLGSIPPSLP